MDLSKVPSSGAINVEDLVFDVEWYHNRYPDLQKAFNHDKGKLLNHWKTFGIKEGRAGSAIFDIKFYLNKYPDLQQAFGTDCTKAYNHFLKNGVNEFRQSSPTFDPKVYKAAYPWLAHLDSKQMAWHFRFEGERKGLLATMTFNTLPVPPMPSVTPQDMVFDADWYHNRYPDLQKAFNHDNGKLLNHWKTFGIKEGRACSDVFDIKFYLNKYPDLQKAFGTDCTKAYNHLFQFGMKEMRQSSPSYDPKIYKERYGLTDLNPQQLMHHYLSYGRHHYMVAI